MMGRRPWSAAGAGPTELVSVLNDGRRELGFPFEFAMETPSLATES